MIPILQLPMLNEVIKKIKRMEPLTEEEELVYLMGVLGMTEQEARKDLSISIAIS